MIPRFPDSISSFHSWKQSAPLEPIITRDLYERLFGPEGRGGPILNRLQGRFLRVIEITDPGVVETEQLDRPDRVLLHFLVADSHVVKTLEPGQLAVDSRGGCGRPGGPPSTSPSRRG